MPVVRATDNPTFDLQGNTIFGLAAPRSGCTQTIMYRLVVPSGTETPTHEHTTRRSSTSPPALSTPGSATTPRPWRPATPSSSRRACGIVVTSTGSEPAALLCVMPAGTLFIRPGHGSGAVPPWGE